MREHQEPSQGSCPKSFKPHTLLVRSLTLGMVLACTGCATTLGYVPAYPKPGGTGSFLHRLPFRSAQWGDAPTYNSVHRWAFDVMDAYGSRATLNRHIDSAGASLAVTSAAAMVGLVTLGSGTSPWIKGLPIGTSFAAGIMTVYANQAKAEVYSAAANHVERMINNSDRRKATMALGNDGARAEVEQKLKELKSEIKGANKTLNAVNAQINSQLQVAQKATAASITQPAVAGGADAIEKSASQDLNQQQAKAAQGAANLTRETANRFEAQLAALQKQEIAMESLQDSLKACAGLAAAASGTTAKKADGTCVSAVNPSSDKGSPVKDDALNTYEALCLRDDVMEVKERVDNLVNDLTPANISDSLKGVGSISGKKNGDWVPTNVIDRAQKDLDFLQSPVVSRCGVF